MEIPMFCVFYMLTFSCIFTAEKNDIKSVCLPYSSLNEYIICDSTQLPIMVLRGDNSFGEKMRKSIPSLKSSDSSSMSSHVLDLRSLGKCLNLTSGL